MYLCRNDKLKIGVKNLKRSISFSIKWFKHIDIFLNFNLQKQILILKMSSRIVKKGQELILNIFLKDLKVPYKYKMSRYSISLVVDE